MKSIDKLIHAYVSMRENGEKITAIALCKKSGVHRSTFYEHFNGIAEFSMYIEESAVSEFTKVTDEYNYDMDGSGLADKLLGKMIEKRDLLYLFFGEKPSAYCVESFFTHAREKTIQKWTLESGQSEEVLELIFAYVSNGLMGILSQWYQSECKAEPNEVKKLMLGLMSYGLYEFVYTK